MDAESSRADIISLLSYAAVEKLLTWLDGNGINTRVHAGFLEGYRTAISEFRSSRALEAGDSFPSEWFRAARVISQKSDHPPQALTRLLDRFEAPLITGLALAVLPRLDSRFGELFADIAADPARRAPAAELITRIVANSKEGGSAGLGRALTARGLLVASGAGLTLPDLVWEALCDDALTSLPAGGTHKNAGDLARVRELAFPTDFLSRLDALTESLSGAVANRRSAPGTARHESDSLVVVLRHDPGVDLAELGGAIARGCGQGLIHLRERSSAGESPTALIARPSGKSMPVSRVTSVKVPSPLLR